MAIHKVDDRVLNFLKKQELSEIITLCITREQLAYEIATARVVVLILLKQKEENGFVQPGRNKMYLM